MRTFAITAAASLLASRTVAAIDINANDQQSVKDAAKTIAKDLMSYYTGNTDQSQVGLLPKPYYWWEAGAMFGTMIGYSYFTGDTQYDGDVAKAIYSQVSDSKDFMMMATQAADLGNDDQAFWGLTAMSAAEHNLPTPDGAPSDIWLTSASGAFNDLIGRWNTTFCGGGIKWQFIQANNGFDYKSSIANAATMQLGARLALHTNNQTYADKAVMVYNWMKDIGYISDSYQVFDGAGDDPDNCTKIDPHEWSYNVANLIGGTAALSSYYSKSGGDASTWSNNAKGLWQHASQNFFMNGVLYEQPCEDVESCDTDQKSFKAYLARWAVFAGQLIPDIMSDVQSKLQSTADAISKSCTGNGGSACGSKWYDNSYSGDTGVGEEMSALEVVIGLLGPNAPWNSNSNNSSSSSSSSSSAASSSTSAPSSASSSNAPAPTTMQTSVVPNSSAAAPSTQNSAGPPSANNIQAAVAGPTASPEPCRENENGVPYMTAPVS